MPADAAWLRDPGRVFPVTVDPTLSDTAYASGSTYAQSGSSNVDHSRDPLLKAGTPDGGSLKAYSFLQFASFASAFAGARFSAVSLKVFLAWGSTCNPKPLNVKPATSDWYTSRV